MLSYYVPGPMLDSKTKIGMNHLFSFFILEGKALEKREEKREGKN